MPRRSKPVKPSLGKIAQVAFMTRDIAASIDHFVDHLGIGPWFMIEGGRFSETRYRGVLWIVLATAVLSAGIVFFGLLFQFHDYGALVDSIDLGTTPT